MDQINVGIDDYDTFNRMTFVMDIFDIFGKNLTLTSFADAFSIIFDEINLSSDKLCKFECDCVNSSNNIAIINIVYKISGAAIVVEFFIDVIYFVIQVMDDSSLSIQLPIEFGASIVETVQLVIYLAVQLSIDVDCDRQVMHNVCCVVYYLFPLLVFLSLYMLYC